MTPSGTYLTFEVSSADPDADPVWVDFTDRVLDVGRELTTRLGRDSELDEPEPGSMSVQLRNRDDALTPGNPTSPYYPWWKQGRRFRIREIVGYLGFDLADGYLEIPEVQVRTQDPDDTDSDVTLTVTAVDVLGRLQNAGRFLSTLAAHVRWAGGSTLLAYWPLGDAAAPVQSYPAGQPLQVRFEQNTTGLDPTDPVLSSITFRGGTALPGDDLIPADFQPARDVTTIPGTTFMTATNSLGSSTVSYGLGAGEVMTIVVWVLSEEAYSFGQAIELFVSPGGAGITWNSAGTALRGYGSDGVNWGTESEGVSPGLNRWVPVAVRFGFDPPVIELWMGTDVYAQTQTVTTPTPTTFTRIEIGTNWRGQIAHAQIYVGAEADWTHDDFLAQYEVGLNALERQTTGERVQSILNYAGFPASRRDIDDGVAVMQPVSLAGKRPLEPLEEATETEQGRLFAQGGRVVFHDRRRVLDV